MREFIGLLAAVVALVTALIGLNKAGIVEVPVISQVPALQNNGGGGGGGGGFDVPTQPLKVAIPDVRGLSLEEAQDRIVERGLGIQRIESTPIQLCDYGPGMVEGTLPPPGTEITEGGSVILNVCG